MTTVRSRVVTVGLCLCLTLAFAALAFAALAYAQADVGGTWNGTIVCHGFDPSISPVSGEMVNAQFTIKTDSHGADKSTLKAESIFSFLPNNVATCKWSFTRTSTAPVPVDPCRSPNPT